MQHQYTKQVTGVRHVKYGKVQFQAHLMDSDAGYQAHSVVALWTHVQGSLFNIVHIHVNDRSDDATIEVQCVESADIDLRDVPFKTD